MYSAMISKNQTACLHKHLTLRHGGGGLIIWACSRDIRPGHLAVIQSSVVYHKILESNVSPSA